MINDIFALLSAFQTTALESYECLFEKTIENHIHWHFIKFYLKENRTKSKLHVFNKRLSALIEAYLFSEKCELVFIIYLEYTSPLRLINLHKKLKDERKKN